MSTCFAEHCRRNVGQSRCMSAMGRRGNACDRSSTFRGGGLLCHRVRFSGHLQLADTPLRKEATIENAGFGGKPGSDFMWVSAIVRDNPPGDFADVSFNRLAADGSIL